MEWHKQIKADLAEAKSRIAELERERDEARERIRLLRTAVKLINHDGLTIAEAAKRIGRSYTWLATRLGWHARPRDEDDAEKGGA